MSHIAFSVRQRRGLFTVGFLVLAVLTVGALWRSHASAQAAERAATDNSNGVTVLLGLADNAFHDRRLVAPAGSNLYEFYLSVLQLDSSNQLALERLHEAFVPACDGVEQDIGQGNLDEAQRELLLLHEYDASRDQGKDSYKLQLLGAYLDAQRMLLTRQHEAQARLIAERQAGAPKGAH
ncbi:MAG: hypothetical protein OQK79_09695 [Rhodanobacter sp.]|nr:hypothetical protein [Rhodanobacter sp.]